MTKNLKFIVAGSVILSLAAAYYVFSGFGSNDLKFAELSSPKGFRTLVQETGFSRSDPIFGQLQQAPEQSGLTAANFCSTLLRDSASPVRGKPDAEISIVEFFDYRCPYCRKLTEILSQLQEKRSVRIIYKEWPILSKGSKLAARAALAAENQGKYDEFHQRLMNARLMPSQAYIKILGEEFNLNQAQLNKDMLSPATTAALQRNAALAYELGLTGTPGLIVGRTIVQGAISKAKLERLIDIEISPATTAVC